MKVLVTGAGGFIGASVTQKLARAGHGVIKIVRPETESEDAATSETLRLDLCEPEALERAVKDEPDLVVHLAAVIPRAFVGAEAERAARLNRRIDENVFRSCRKLGVGVVYASSTSVYGIGTGGRKRESSDVNPIGPYATAKLLSERVAEGLFSGNGLFFTALRINAPYGPGQRTRTVMTIFIERALEGLPLCYHGTGARQQDFTHVEDVAAAVLKAAQKCPNGIYDIAGGHPVSMRQLAELIVECVPNCASPVGPSGEPDMQEGATALYSIEKAGKEIGWQPQVSLRAGIEAWVATRL